MLRGCLLAGALPALVACAGDDAQLSAHVAPELGAWLPQPIAVFGVYRDGRMNTKAWDDVSTELDAVGLEPCGALYDTDNVTSNAELAAAVDDYTRQFGVSDALLAAFGPAAKADLVLVLVVSGAIPSKHSAPEEPRPPPSPNMYRGQRGYAPRPQPHHDRGALEITASLYSTSRHAAVAAVSLRYTGRSENEAFAQVNAKLKDLFPGAACGGWDLVAHPLDPSAVRSLPED
jgi:hypothetical protein